ncbi:MULTISPECIES: matrixin family metalloprotease [Methylomonas]|uniref:Peptidase M10A and M12B matrixin and adamalysin n=2 Tax=Methylomonas TaxID=416 RepID=A0A126T6N6_9GAMM|nr:MULTISPECIES: matrixin family metalloprotease [Methylomonas]AMK77742.1 peptidase M10A and M12B matrixin and adamalysin [Methylomonas denitrificans]OAI08674.1 peptidase M10A and M12B matrixin and adamalysin [Methylomonas methanica]TCV86915.1 putative secreted protein with PEP-CTERM sorting signal [Methylomonas methanica]
MFIKPSALAGVVLLAASQSADAVVINFDYTYDGGFFSGGNASRRNILDAAGGFLGSILTDSLTAITSGGGNSFNAVFQRPDTGATTTLSNFNVAANALTVFVGGQSMSPGSLGYGGYGGYGISGTQDFLNNAARRGQSNPTSGPSATDFAPWGGQLIFSSSADWYFDTDLTTTEAFSGNDFYSVALHELGHLLGLGSSDSWMNKASGTSFTGTNAVAAYGGNVPLEGDKVHWFDGTKSTVNGVEQESAMDPTIHVGTRKVFTQLDLAALKDVGWQVSVTAVPVPSAVWLFGSALLGFIVSKRKQNSSF